MLLNRKLTFVEAAMIILLGAGLRIYAACGALWLDEISTLALVGRMHNPLAPFLLAHDNNHILNSLYIYFVGVDASPLFQRGFSIVLGMATVAAAGLAVADRGRVAMLLAMLLFAIAFPMVNYGSEARGYAGLILCTVLAIHFLDRQLREGGRRWQLALAIFFGMLFHMTMAASAAALALYAFVDRWLETRALKKAVTRTLWIFAPAIGLMTVIAIDLAAAAFSTHEVVFGSITPFLHLGFIIGYSGMIMAVLGLPGSLATPIGLVFAGAAVLLCFFLRAQGDKRPGIYFVFIFVLPLAIFICHIPNSHIARYYLPSAIAFLLCLADLGTLLWARGFELRVIVALALFAFIVQNAMALHLFFTSGRSHYADVVAIITANGPTTYGGTTSDYINRSEVQFYAARAHASATYVPADQYCNTPPAWLIAAVEPASPLALLVWGPESCRLSFQRVQIFPVFGMSGLTVTLYRRAN